jgi:hypothetical protein
MQILMHIQAIMISNNAISAPPITILTVLCLLLQERTPGSGLGSSAVAWPGCRRNKWKLYRLL